ncbi:MAG: DUF4316 domain-containing protein [Clostridia bacterium]|nr:DUF4316 domain-containing protein [Clostridia bacterium]
MAVDMANKNNSETENEHIRSEPGTVPDPTIHPNALQYYGFTDADMLPITKNRALELLERDLTVYMISPLNTEKIALDAEDLLRHDGLFGVTKTEWEAVKNDIPPYDAEQTFRNNPKDSYAIYQLADTPDTIPLRFMGTDWLEQKNIPVEKSNYTALYTGDLPTQPTRMGALEKIYENFNLYRPADFTGHSLSVSDVVALKQNGQISYHYCDHVGFKELPDFGQDSPLKNAEMLLEDDYSMIDGRINNGKSALAEEKKPSVLERLKTPPEPPKIPKIPGKSKDMAL